MIGTQEGVLDQLEGLVERLPSHYAWVGEGRAGGNDGESSPRSSSTPGAWTLSRSTSAGSRRPPMSRGRGRGGRPIRAPSPASTSATGWEDAASGSSTSTSTIGRIARAPTPRACCSTEPARGPRAAPGGRRHRRLQRRPGPRPAPHAHGGRNSRGRRTERTRGCGGRLRDVDTFHFYRGVRRGGRRIDWLLHSGGLAATAAGTNTFARDGRFPSDDFPVQALLRWDTDE